ncbi:hypothetical protein MRX96_032771 [Rhipicephalus microplus]
MRSVVHLKMAALVASSRSTVLMTGRCARWSPRARRQRTDRIPVAIFIITADSSHVTSRRRSQRRSIEGAACVVGAVNAHLDDIVRDLLPRVIAEISLFFATWCAGGSDVAIFV